MEISWAKKLLHRKGNYQENEGNTKWEEIFANHLSDKGLTSKIYKEHLYLNSNNQTKTKQNKTIWLNNGQNKWIDIFSNMRYKWPIGTWEGAQNHQSSGKCKSKPQWYYLIPVRKGRGNEWMLVRM